jgi:parvulin-like peptidyl-prolyl isomerase
LRDSGSGEATVPEGAIAVVGKDEISRRDLGAFWRQTRASFALQGRPFPRQGTAPYAALRRRAVAFLVEQTLYEQEAGRRKIEPSDREVTERLALVKRDLFGANERRYRAELRRRGLSERDVRETLRGQLIRQRLLTAVLRVVSVSEAELRSHFRRHRADFVRRESRMIGHVLVHNSDDADEVASELRGGADLASLARRRSLDRFTAARNGRFLAERGRTTPHFEQVVFKLEIGEVATVQTEHGWHVIKALGPPVAPTQLAFSAIRASLRISLTKARQKKAIRAWTADLLLRHAPKIRYAPAFRPDLASSTPSPP